MPIEKISKIPYVESLRELVEKEKDYVRKKGLDEIEFEVDTYELERLSERYDAEYIGSGAECVVITQEKEGDITKLVVAIDYEDLSPQRAKEIFYYQRIFSTLFPDNFPRFYAAFGGEYPNVVSGTVREKVDLSDKVTQLFHTPSLNSSDPSVAYPISRVIETCDNLSIPFFDLIDDTRTHLENVEIGQNKNGEQCEYYVDRIEHHPKRAAAFNSQEWNFPKIIDFLSSNQDTYTNRDQRIILKSFKRLGSPEIGAITFSDGDKKLIDDYLESLANRPDS